jgi:YVTN family beta-propeller protein
MLHFLRGVLLLASNFLPVSRALSKTTSPVVLTAPVRRWARRAAFALGFALLPAAANAQNAYITNNDDNTVSVIDTASDTVIATIPVTPRPGGVAVTPDGSRAFVTGDDGNYNTVSVIDTASNTVTAAITVGSGRGVAITPDSTKAYVSNFIDNTISVIDTASDTVIATIPVAPRPTGVAVTQDGTKAYIATESSAISVIDTASNMVTATITLGSGVSNDLAVTPDGSKLYVTGDVSGGGRT